MKKLSVVGLSILATLLLLFAGGEIYLRATHEYWTVKNTLKFENSIFSRHIIKEKEQTVKKFGNPNIKLQINRHGYRGEAFEKTKPAGQYRVLVYGGSQVFDHTGKPPGWPDLAEDKLHEQGYDSIEIINAGIPGHASFDSYGRLFANDHFYDPDLVVLLNAWNDFKYFHYETAPIRQVKVYRKENNLSRYYQNPLDRFLGEHSQAYTVLRQYSIHYLYMGGQKHPTEKIQERDTPSAAALRQYRLNLRAFVNHAISLGTTPVLMTQPRLVTETMSKQDRKKISFNYLGLTPRGLVRAYNKSDRIIQTVANGTNAPVWDASDRFTGDNQYFIDHVHFSQNGSEAMAEYFSQKVLDRRQHHR